MKKKRTPPEVSGSRSEQDLEQPARKIFEIGVDLKAVIDSLPFPVAVVDLPDENIVYWSRTAQELFGHTADTTEEWYQIAYPDPNYRRDVVKRWKQILKQARKAGDSVNAGAYRVTCKDGSIRICELHAKFLPSTLIVSFNDITERQKAVEALAESEEKFRAIDSASTDFIYSYNSEGRFTHANPSLCSALGLTEEQIVGKTHRELGFPEEQIREWDELHRKVYETGKTLRAETSTPMPGKGERFYEVVLNPLHDANGEVKGITGVSRDVTDRKLSEITLRESEARWRSYIERAPIAVLIADREGRYVEANPAASAITGYSEAEILGKHITDFLSPEGRSAGREHFQRLLREGFSIGEIPFVHKSGELRVWRVSAVELTEDRFLGFVEDITERKQAERRVRESREELSQIIEGSSIATLVIDSEHRVTHWNRACEELTGYKSEEMVGTGLPWKAFYPEERPILADIVMGPHPEPELARWYGERYRKSPLLEGVYEVEDFLSKLGEEGKWVSFSAIPLKNEEGKLLGAVEMLQDITSSKLHEEELRREKDLVDRIINDGPVGIVILDLEGVIISANPRAERILGLSRDVLRGRKYNSPEWNIAGLQGEAFPDDQLPFRRAIKTGRAVYEVEHSIVWPDGTQKTLLVNAAPLIDKDGEIERVVCTIDDVTDKQHAAEALRSKTILLEAQAETSIDGIVAADENGRIILWNSRFAEMWGIPRHFFDSREREPLQECVLPLLSDPEGFISRIEYLYDHPDEKSRDEIQLTDGRVFDRYSSPLIDEDGGSRGRIWFYRDITELKNIQEKYRQSVEFHQSVFRVAPVGIGVVHDRVFQQVNQKFCKMIGYREDELTGQNARMVYPSDEDYEVVGRVKYAQIEKSGSGTIETRMQRKDGSLINVILSSTPLDSGDLSKGVTFTVLDVTDQKRAEEDLRESRRMLQAALDHSHAGIAIADAPDGALRYVNQAALEIRGSFRSEIVEGVDIGKYVSMWQIYHFDGTPYRDEEVPLARAVMAGETVSEEFIIRRPDGENRVVWANAAPILDEEGNVISGIVIFLDITERKQIEESLRRKEEMLTRTERIAKVGSWEWDIDPDRVTWSEELFNFFGLDPSEGAPPFGEQAKIYIGEDFEELKRAVELCRTKGTPYDLQLRTVRADGEIRHCIVSGVAERDVSGEISRLAGSFQDITERVVQEREREALQRQLVQAQRLESIGRLAGGVAHDFNNMLSVILGNAELAMLDIGKDQPVHNNLEEILVAAERSRDVTRQLLAFARKQTIAPESRIIDEVLSGMQNMLKRLIGEDIELTLVLSEKPWTVRLDPTQLEQAVINLCLNARDAISGQGRISLKTENVTFDEKDAASAPGVSPGDFVLLEVSDNGCGMDQETLDSVFEPFFTTKESEQGTGLGMATVYGIVMQSGGFILPSSDPGKGSTFRLYFPRCKVRGRTKKQEKESTLPLACSERILLVEDEAAVMTMARRMLEKQGYRVLAAEDPSAALDLVSSDPEPLDLLITDVVMPGMNGRELVQKMQEYHPGIKVIYMSGYTADVIAKQGVLEEGVHFLQKPFSSQDLGQLVRDVLNE